MELRDEDCEMYEIDGAATCYGENGATIPLVLMELGVLFGCYKRLNRCVS